VQYAPFRRERYPETLVVNPAPNPHWDLIGRLAQHQTTHATAVAALHSSAYAQDETLHAIDAGMASGSDGPPVYCRAESPGASIHGFAGPIGGSEMERHAAEDPFQEPEPPCPGSSGFQLGLGDFGDFGSGSPAPGVEAFGSSSAGGWGGLVQHPPPASSAFTGAAGPFPGSGAPVQATRLEAGAISGEGFPGEEDDIGILNGRMEDMPPPAYTSAAGAAPAGGWGAQEGPAPADPPRWGGLQEDALGAVGAPGGVAWNVAFPDAPTTTPPRPPPPAPAREASAAAAVGPAAGEEGGSSSSFPELPDEIFAAAAAAAMEGEGERGGARAGSTKMATAEAAAERSRSVSEDQMSRALALSLQEDDGSGVT